MSEWTGKFGEEYTLRNYMSVEGLNELYVKQFGITRREMNREFLSGVDRNSRILEVGCNIGTQLLLLEDMGFTNLTGIELQPLAVQLARGRTKDIVIWQGSASDIPFKDNYFDLVFTSGVLIHVPPDQIDTVIDEIVRCSKKYIWGMEYYAPEYTEINYRGHTNMLWKADFMRMYLKRSLALVKEMKFRYLANDNADSMFLLEKL